jgi:hypothetical protein
MGRLSGSWAAEDRKVGGSTPPLATKVVAAQHFSGFRHLT